jgi:Flp pilus assembly pilin Flp
MILFFVSIVMAGALMLLGSTLDESFYQLAAEVFR